MKLNSPVSPGKRTRRKVAPAPFPRIDNVEGEAGRTKHGLQNPRPLLQSLYWIQQSVPRSHPTPSYPSGLFEYRTVAPSGL
jgi:hypothetical protein